MAKNKFDELDEDFKADVDNFDEAQARSKLAQIALDHAELMEAKGNDEDLKEKREAAKEANAIYSEGSKMNKLRTEYIRERMRAMGKL